MKILLAGAVIVFATSCTTLSNRRDLYMPHQEFNGNANLAHDRQSDRPRTPEEKSQANLSVPE